MEKEIVSLRRRDGDDIMFIRVDRETDDIIASDGRVHYKSQYPHIHRNLKAMPHKDFGRACEVDGSDANPHWFLAPWGMYAVGKGTIFVDAQNTVRSRSKGKITFLDETPEIKITIEINGEQSSLSDISEETLLRIRNKK